MVSLVLLGVGDRGGAQERQAKRAALACVAVLAVVDERRTVPKLGDVGKAVACTNTFRCQSRKRCNRLAGKQAGRTADLELGPLPRRVAMRRALAEAELVLVRPLRGA